MHQLITTKQENELTRLLNDQKISIKNVTIKETDRGLINPFSSIGTKIKFKNVEDWFNYIKNYKK